MAYTKQTWVDGEAGGTPLSAARLNYLETGVDTAHDTADAAETPAGAQAKVDAHSGDTSAAHAASAVSFAPAGALSATDVQAALVELDSEKVPGTGLWTSYTPTLVNFTGTVGWARYRVVGKSVRVQFNVTLDAAPSGRMEVSPPVAAATGLPTGNLGPIGDVIGNDVGTARRVGASFFLGSTIAFGSNDAASFWGVSTPHVWESGDTIAFNAEYEID